MNYYESCSLNLIKNQKGNLFTVNGSYDFEKFLISLIGYCDKDTIETKDFKYIILQLLSTIHEKFHSLQFFSTTLGLLYGIINQAKYHSLSKIITDGASAPLFGTLQNDSAYKDLRSTIEHFDFFQFLLEGDFSKSDYESITSLVNQYTISRNYILYLYEQLLGQFFGMLGIPVSKIDQEAINQFLDDNQDSVLIKNFVVKVTDGHSFGTKHILEGAARINDIQRIRQKTDNTTDETYIKVLHDVELQLSQSSIYYDAYDIYNQYIRFEDEMVNMLFFQIVCDYSLNINIPPLCDDAMAAMTLIDPKMLFPQNRFLYICSATRRYLIQNKTLDQNGVQRSNIEDNQNIEEMLRDLGTTIKFIDPTSLSGWNEITIAFYESIEKATGYPSPLTTAKKSVEFCTQPIEGVPMSLYAFSKHFDRYQAACKIRIECPLFTCAPEMVHWLDKERYLKYDAILGPSIMEINGKVFRTNRNEDHDDITKNLWFEAINILFKHKKIVLSKLYQKYRTSKSNLASCLISLFGEEIKQYLQY